MKKKSSPTIEDYLYLLGWLAAAAAAALPSISRLLPPCLFYQISGYYCPGCGGTRAVKALCRGQFFRALWYHPLVPYLAVGFGGFMVTQGLHRVGTRLIRGWRFHQWYLYGAVFLVLANFILKNMLRLIWGITL